MFRIVVDKPTMLCVDDALPVSVFDADTGVLFYKSPSNFKGHFSLPKGTYTSTQPLKKSRRKRKLPLLPKQERNIPRPKKWVIFFDKNPAKCSIKLESGEILFDTELWQKLNKVERLFVLLHEYGHYYYKTERFCDLFAKHHLLKLGYNKSQIAVVDFGILGNGKSSFDRKHWTYYKIKNL